MAKGKIVDWKLDRGFGFVRPHDGGRDVFLHISDIRHDDYEPKIGDEVSFSLKQDAQGRQRAEMVIVAGVRRSRADIQRSRNKWADVLAVLVSAIFFLGLYGMDEYRPVLFVYLGMSVAAVIAYAIDKQSAMSGGWRTSEATLHSIDLLGGWPGAILAQLLFRHKTRKPSFQFVFWMIVAAHIGFWAWLQITGQPLDELVGLLLKIADAISR